MRHHPFRIDRAAHDAWPTHMLAAVATIDGRTLDDEHRAALVDYLTRAAAMMGKKRVHMASMQKTPCSRAALTTCCAPACVAVKDFSTSTALPRAMAASAMSR